MSFDLFFRAGGYWTREDHYVGGEAHAIGTISTDDFSLNRVRVLIDHLGYAENMRLVSWFPPDTPHQKQDILDEDLLKKILCYGIGSGALTLFFVIEDDPYVGRCVDNDLGYLSEEDDGIARIGDVVEFEEADDNEVAEDAIVVAQYEDMFESSDDELNNEIDESSYKMFRLGQEYKTIQSFKSAIINYAVKRKRDIKF